MFPIVSKLLARPCASDDSKQTYARSEHTMPRPLHDEKAIAFFQVFPGVTPAPQYPTRLTTHQSKVKPMTDQNRGRGSGLAGTTTRSHPKPGTYLTSTVA